METTLSYHIDGQDVDVHFAPIHKLKQFTSQQKIIIITDDNVASKYNEFLSAFDNIIIPHGETNKNLQSIISIIEQLIELNADRHTLLIGMGGGVVTDITGFVASIYMRGIKCAYIPTTLLNMVDAAIGGKNGVDVGVYKNMAGTIRQPYFMLYDTTLLQTLPSEEWINGFAEIIKHALILDKNLYETLAQNNILFYKNNPEKLQELIIKNVQIKMGIVQDDTHESHLRKILNFGHTYGHAIENLNSLSHGNAISIGMVVAAKLSHMINGFKNINEVIEILNRYDLPTHYSTDYNRVIQVLSKDKKKEGNSIHYVLLKEIGAAYTQQISLETLKDFFNNCIDH